MDVRMFTVGPVAENTYIFRRDGSDRALIVDPGDEADTLLGRASRSWASRSTASCSRTRTSTTSGAVAPVAKATGAEVWVPESEKFVLDDINSFVPVAGLRPVRVLRRRAHAEGGRDARRWRASRSTSSSRPGHSPGHVTFSIPDEQAIFSGDVLFQGSVGRTDLPGGDWGTLLESIRTLVDTLPEETAVYPGHMGITSLGAERASNPFLAELAR